MLLPLLLAALPLLPTAISAPVQGFAYPPPDSLPSLCTLHLNQSIQTNIFYTADQRYGWLPQNLDSYPIDVLASNLGDFAEPQPQWTVYHTPPEGAHKIVLTEYEAVCASGSGTGGNSTRISFVDCDSEYALWKITCNFCTPSFGGACHLRPVFRSSSSASSDGPEPCEDLCATAPVGEYGPTGDSVYLAECQPFEKPPEEWNQLWSLGFPPL
ncbi:hypothetical protein JCM8097_002358 [Rhodosporidiobolus ruineniae]